MIDGLVQAIPGIVVVIVGWFFMCFLSGAKERIEEKTKEAGAGFVDNLSRYGSAVFRIFLIVVIFTLIKVHKAEVTPNTASTTTNENPDAADSSRLSNPAE